MWLQRFSNYILTHRFKALLITFFITFIPFGVGTPVAIWIAAFVLLQKGVLEGAFFTIAASLIFAVVAVITYYQDGAIPMALIIGIGFAVLSNLVTFIGGVALLRKVSFSTILQISALLGVLAISILHLAYPPIANWWGVELQRFSTQMPSMLSAFNNDTPEMQVQMLDIAKQCASGVLVAAVLIQGLLQLVIGRWWQSAVVSPGLLRKELHQIRLSKLAGVLLLVSVVLSYLGNSVVLDIMPVLCVLFMAAGLSLVHYFFGLMTSNTKLIWLALFYFVVIFSMPMSAMVLASFALLDTWVDLRKRFKKV